MNENRQRTRVEYNHHPKATRLTLARPGDPLFDNAAANLGGYQSPFGFPNGPAKRGIGDACLPRKPGEGLVLEYSHRPTKYNTEYYSSRTLKTRRTCGCRPFKFFTILL